MATTEDLGIALAADVLKAVEETGDESLIGEINKIVEAASSGLQEAHMSAIRAQRAEAKARAFLNARVARLTAKQKTEEA